MFSDAIAEFNANRAEVLGQGLCKVLDESMSAWKPRKDKLGGLPNISYIVRTPKPLGTEFKCIVDADTCVMLKLEVQEGKFPMREKKHFKELGATAACVRRLADCCPPGSTIVGDSWFGSIKVCLR